MATASYKCPKCNEWVDVYGRNRKEADRQATYLEKRGDVCHKCERAEWQAENEKAVETSKEAGLVELDGSDKQVAWASKIRLETIAQIDKAAAEMLAEAHENPGEFSEAAIAEFTDAIALIVSEIKNQQLASWWISSRNTRADVLIQIEWKARGKTLAPTLFAEMSR